MHTQEHISATHSSTASRHGGQGARWIRFGAAQVRRCTGAWCGGFPSSASASVLENDEVICGHAPMSSRHVPPSSSCLPFNNHGLSRKSWGAAARPERPQARKGDGGQLSRVSSHGAGQARSPGGPDPRARRGRAQHERSGGADQPRALRRPPAPRLLRGRAEGCARRLLCRPRCLHRAAGRGWGCTRAPAQASSRSSGG